MSSDKPVLYCYGIALYYKTPKKNALYRAVTAINIKHDTKYRLLPNTALRGLFLTLKNKSKYTKDKSNSYKIEFWNSNYIGKQSIQNCQLPELPKYTNEFLKNILKIY
jgi:hypothetical protein